MKKFEDLKSRNKLLANKIAELERLQNEDDAIELKKELYQNKIEMLEFISYKNKKTSISARVLMDKVDNMPHATRYATGLSYLDNNLKINQTDIGGFEVGSLIIIGGQSGAGKSHILLDMLSNVSKYSKCVFFNFEMGDRRLNTRLKRLLKTDEQKDNFTINSESRDLDDLLMEINILADEGVKFFSIDSRMKITVKGSDAEYQKIASITKKLSEVAIKNDIIVILINQISEDNLKTKTLAFKGSGDQLYDADMAFFLTIEEDEKRLLICKKNRQDEFLFSVEVPAPRDNKVIETVYEDYSNVSMATI